MDETVSQLHKSILGILEQRTLKGEQEEALRRLMIEAFEITANRLNEQDQEIDALTSRVEALEAKLG